MQKTHERLSSVRWGHFNPISPTSLMSLQNLSKYASNRIQQALPEEANCYYKKRMSCKWFNHHLAITSSLGWRD